MFTNKDKGQSTAERTQPGNATLISAGTSLTGDIVSNNDLRIDGTIKGNIHCTAKVIIGAAGVVAGHIESAQAEICGSVEGNISVKELLQLKGQCTVNGNIAAGRLLIEPSATFNGNCHMTNAAAGQVVQMAETEITLAKAK